MNGYVFQLEQVRSKKIFRRREVDRPTDPMCRNNGPPTPCGKQYHNTNCSYAVSLMARCTPVCGFGQTVIFAQARTTHSVFGPTLQRWNRSQFSLSLVTNIVATSLVAFRIWKVVSPISPRFQLIVGQASRKTACYFVFLQIPQSAHAGH